MGFFAVRGPVLELWTVATGPSGQTIVHVAGYHGGSRSNCAGLSFDEAPLMVRLALCVTYPDASQAPPRAQRSPLLHHRDPAADAKPAAR